MPHQSLFCFAVCLKPLCDCVFFPPLCVLEARQGSCCVYLALQLLCLQALHTVWHLDMILYILACKARSNVAELPAMLMRPTSFQFVLVAISYSDLLSCRCCSHPCQSSGWCPRRSQLLLSFNTISVQCTKLVNAGVYSAQQGTAPILSWMSGCPQLCQQHTGPNGVLHC